MQNSYMFLETNMCYIGKAFFVKKEKCLQFCISTQPLCCSLKQPNFFWHCEAENKGADDFKRQLITAAVSFERLAQKVETAKLL